MRRLLLLSVLVFSVLVGGCGGGGASGGGVDPATFVPADSTFYFEAVVRPDGETKDDVRALAGKILRTEDPSAKIASLIDDAIRKSGETGTTYKDDIDPWLGDRIGIGLSDLQADEPRFVAAIATRDADAAQTFAAEQAKRDKSRAASAGDVDFWIDKDGQAAGVVGDAVVIASDEKKFRAAVTAADGPNLSKSKTFKAAIGELPDERVGTFFFDLPRVFDAALAASGNDPMSAAIAKQFTGAVQPVAGAVLATADTLAVETRGKTPKAGTPLSALGAATGGVTPLLREAPAGSWGAMGVPKLGATAKQLFETVGGAIGGAVLGGQLEQQTGINLDQDVFGWIGDVALFARGKTVADIDGAAVIEVTNRERAAKAIPKLIGLARQQAGAPFEPVKVKGATLAFAAALPDAPKPLVVALGGDRAVIAFGEDAAADGLAPAQTIEDDGTYGRATALTDGLEPTVLLDGPTVIGLIEQSVADDPDFAKAKPYLDMIGTVAAGSGKDGDRLRQRFAVKVR
jgi:hypothetical protein